MKRTLIGISALALSQLACPKAPMSSSTQTSAPKSELSSGIDATAMDSAVRPQDNFYRYVNGRWLDETQIPADKAVWGAFTKLAEDSQNSLRSIIETASKQPNRAPGSEAQKIGDLYASFMDEARAESLGAKPLAPYFAKVNAIEDKKQLAQLIGSQGQFTDVPFGILIHQDNKDSTKYIADLQQSGLGLPDRDYYLVDDPKLKSALAAYQAHITRMFTLAGEANAAEEAGEIVKLETALAKVQWTKVENRDPQKTYNKFELGKLAELAPGIDWKAFLVAAALDGKIDHLFIAQPSYITGLGKAIEEIPLPAWKSYLRWQVLRTFAPFMSKAFVDESFAFNGTVLSGIPENRPRWKRGVSLVDAMIGEGLGKLYVAEYFPPESKARMEALVGNLLKAYSESIEHLDWMSAKTKLAAHAKLAKFTPKIGYPAKWRDYSALNFTADDLVGNVERGATFEYFRNIKKLGQPIDRGEWGMYPQTVNAYYNPELNEIVFPAAILQPPFFNPKADDAVNYGGIGAVIGHEISHGFDDQGAQYDGDGNLRDWWTAEDHAAFAAKTKALVAQYSALETVPGYHVNGELTLGENIADNSGLAIAYKAYQISLNGGEGPVIDNLSADQRLYMGWAQVWRAKVRENEAIRRIKTDPHSPPSIRGSATLENQPGFFKAFDVKPGDKMYVEPDKRIIIW